MQVPSNLFLNKIGKPAIYLPIVSTSGNKLPPILNWFHASTYETSSFPNLPNEAMTDPKCLVYDRLGSNIRSYCSMRKLCGTGGLPFHAWICRSSILSRVSILSILLVYSYVAKSQIRHDTKISVQAKNLVFEPLCSIPGP
jgi:hypothetical protein